MTTATNSTTRWWSGRAAPLLVAALLAGSCSSGDDSGVDASDAASTTSSPGDPAPSDPASSDPAPSDPAPSDSVAEQPEDPPPTGPAPGVTDDTITIGINYVDTAALLANANLDYDLGDHRAVYQAIIDDINADGGIHGRTLRAVFAPIDPTDAEAADEVCLQLTEDDDVFLITGFFLLDAVLCPLDLHETAVVGGSQTPERVAQAKAPWVTWLPDTDQPKAVIRAFFEGGELDGTVAVYASVADQVEMENHVLPTLDELGVDVIASGIMDAPTGDTAAISARVQLLAERFESDGADTVLLVGASGATWPQYLAGESNYRPNLLFLSTVAVRSFATNGSTTDTSILDGALAGGGYGPEQARYDEPEMQACISTLREAGLDTPAPAGFDDDDPSNQPYQAAFQACPDMALTRALLEAAGTTLNYATLAGAIDGLTVGIPGDPTPRTFGAGSAGDGDPVAYLYRWDTDLQDVVLDKEGI